MKLGNLNSFNVNQNFRGILVFDKKIQEKSRLYNSTVYEYNYYPFSDETEDEIKEQENLFRRTKGQYDRYWDGINMTTNEKCGGCLIHNFNVKEKLPITVPEYVSMQLKGLSDIKILRNLLKK